MTLSRRRFLGRLGLGGLGPAALATPLWSGCGGEPDETRIAPADGGSAPADPEEVRAWPVPAAAALPFSHGVASGDPLPDGVVLWTRVTPPVDAAASAVPIEVEWRIALDPEQRELVQQGSARAEAEDDYTLHVDVGGLSPATTYYYQFRALGQTSARGRTRTLPAGDVARARFAITSCANYPAGFFNAYARLARTDLDLVLHLGATTAVATGVVGESPTHSRNPPR